MCRKSDNLSLLRHIRTSEGERILELTALNQRKEGTTVGITDTADFYPGVLDYPLDTFLKLV